MDNYTLSLRNTFVAHTLDRRARQRRDEQWRLARLAEDSTRIVPLWRDGHAWAPGAGERPVFLPPAEIGVPEALVGASVLLGTMADTVYFALDLPGQEAAVSALVPPRTEFRALREIAPLLGEEEGALLAYARAMVNWHGQHRYCGRCGAHTRSAEGGHLRVCSDAACAQKHFPRTDCAVIVLVTDTCDGEERCLLGRQPNWAPGVYSAVAGFVEPGESIESAVVREVEEETGVCVAEVRYRSSQPWPFPSSLMLGFTARASSRQIDLGDEELEDARWFSREAVVAGLKAGSLRLPRRVSIAYRLFEDWFDEGVPGKLARISHQVA